MKKILVFPGQGSQKVGMGKDLYDSFPEAKEVFQEIDDALSQKLSQIIFSGEEEELTRTANAQPAIMAVSIAVMRVLQKGGFDIAKQAAFVAGHSLGEYSALCAAGSYDAATTAKLLRIRGNAMQKAVPEGVGAMAAILGLEYEKIKEICENSKGVCEIANDNSAGQVVISGEKQAIEKAMEMAKEGGAKRALLLPVSAPFHCSLIKSAADEMQQAIGNNMPIRPSVPVVQNVVVQPVIDPQEIKKNLVAQVVGTVRWRETMEFFNAKEATHIIEIGHGGVLSGLAKRACTAEIISLASPKDIEAFFAKA